MRIEEDFLESQIMQLYQVRQISEVTGVIDQLTDLSADLFNSQHTTTEKELEGLVRKLNDETFDTNLRLHRKLGDYLLTNGIERLSYPLNKWMFPNEMRDYLNAMILILRLNTEE